MADISQITLPNGTTYDIKDSVARASAGGGLQFRGVTTTTITDGATTTTYTINGTNHTAANADMVVYGNKEFIFTTADNKWHELGDNTSLGALAYKDSGTYKRTTAVSVSTNTTEDKATSVTGTPVLPNGGPADYTPAGTIGLTTSNTTAKVTGSTTIPSGKTKSYTPSGTISVATNGAGSTTTIHNPASVTVATGIATAAPGTTAPSNAITYYSVSGEVLSLYQLGYTTGDSITTTDVTVKNGDASYSFSGDDAYFVTDNIAVPTSAEFTGTGTKLTTGQILVPNTYTATITEQDTAVTFS